MATVVRYVNPGSSGGDGTTSALSGANAAYASLSAWEAAEQTDLDTANNIMQVNCAGTTADTTACTINGWTTSATDYIDIIGDYAVTTGANWSTNYYRLIAAVTGAGVISIQEDFVRFNKIQVQNTNTPASGNDCAIEFLPPTDTTNMFWLSKVIMRGGRYTVRVTHTNITNVNVWNSIFYGPSVGSWGIANKVHVINGYSTVFIGGSGQGLLNASNATLVLKNCYAYASGAGVAYPASTQTTCAADDTTATDNSLDNIAYSTDNFTNVTANSEDFHLVLNSALIDVGTDTSGDASPLNFTDDIDGVTRSGTWDIGADEYVASGGGAATSYGYLSTNKGFW